MHHRTASGFRSALVCTADDTLLEFTARLWLRTAVLVWAGWLGLLGVLLVRT